MASGKPLTAALAALHGLPRTPLAATPTPLLPAPRLAERLGAQARLWIKADAWTGFGLGGNKVRKLEYELAPHRLAGITHLVTEGGPQSNHCRVAAAAAARLGLSCTLVVNGPGGAGVVRQADPGEAGADAVYELDPGAAHGDPRTAHGAKRQAGAGARGNALLHRLLGARVVVVDGREGRGPRMAEEAKRIAAAGGKALVVPAGASTPLGAVGYAHAALEMESQLGGAEARVFCSASSGGTMAGLVLGAALAGWPAHFTAVSADEPAARLREKVAALAHGAAELVVGGREGLERLTRRVDATLAAMDATDAFVGPGYGAPTPESEAALAAFAQGAGVILDPVYTAKAAAAMIAALADEVPSADQRWVFLHTGGHPALFA